MERTLLVKSSRASVDLISMSSMVVAFSMNFWRQSSAKFSATVSPILPLISAPVSPRQIVPMHQVWSVG